MRCDFAGRDASCAPGGWWLNPTNAPPQSRISGLASAPAVRAAGSTPRKGAANSSSALGRLLRHAIIPAGSHRQVKIILLSFLRQDRLIAFLIDRPVLLSDVIRKTPLLEMKCRQCGRAGRPSVRRLIQDHGSEATA